MLVISVYQNIMLSALSKFFLDILFPKFCLGCGKEKIYLCSDCFLKINLFSAPFCPYCNNRIYNGKIHKGCKKNLTGFVSAVSYKDKFCRKIIATYKYSLVKELSEPLSYLVYKFLVSNPEVEFFKNPLNFLIAPIPLHSQKLRYRGFNQAEEISKHLSSLLRIPRENVLVRNKNTASQTKIEDYKQRRNNIEGAFRIKDETEIQSKKVILVDDVATSLSTLEEAARELKACGAKEVWGLVVAKG